MDEQNESSLIDYAEKALIYAPLFKGLKRKNSYLDLSP